MGKTWTAVAVTVSPELAESIGSFLVDQGAPGVMTEDEGGFTRVTAHFAAAPPLAALEHFAAELRDFFPHAATPRIETYLVPERDWAENWKEHFPPMAIGERLFVHPPWIDETPTGRAGIVIDPGMAFGTGQHASTRGCLVLLEDALRARPAATVCDLGTGSGILAIAAAKLGAAEVWATDIDADACAIAVENAGRNGVERVVHVRDSLGQLPAQFDVIVANLLGHLLIELVPQLEDRLRTGGVLIGAGFRTNEERDVVGAWNAHGVAVSGRYEEDGWVTLVARRP